MSAHRLKFIPIAICLAFGLAACGDDGYSNDQSTTPVDEAGGYDYGASSNSPSTTVAGATDTTVDDSGEGDDVILADSDLGQILVDADGMTLYLFANDPTDVATCTGGCASTWPALLADDDHIHAGDGLDEGQFTLVDGEGGQQWSYFGHPLYHYAGDSAPGDTNGNGVGSVWFAIGADGDPVT